NPDMAFFLAIAPWPYADLYPSLKEHVAVKDYRKYNLVEPVLKPVAMSLQELERELANASKTFFMHKFQNLDQLSPWKQQFMTEVFRLLVNNSYLAKQMREMATEGGAMPDAIKNALQKKTGEHLPPKTIPPLP
ncbi:MAG: magnesium-protoporphyrin IX monomethyl ester oxidative cyclase, partial [Desulfuromonadales bacterium]|nr:magnesium-protoporphyrin IX monomethyl ester oxidative cyclase [Desulfuromonadales bacterium]